MFKFFNLLYFCNGTAALASGNVLPTTTAFLNAWEIRYSKTLFFKPDPLDTAPIASLISLPCGNMIYGLPVRNATTIALTPLTINKSHCLIFSNTEKLSLCFLKILHKNSLNGQKTGLFWYMNFSPPSTALGI